MTELFNNREIATGICLGMVVSLGLMKMGQDVNEVLMRYCMKNIANEKADSDVAR